MQAAIPGNTPQKAGRRVLGEKTANASLTPATKRIADANAQKFQAATIPYIASVKKSSPTKTRDISSGACHAGQKRSIDQVVENIKEAESEPRKVLMTSQTEVEGEFEILSDDNGTQSRQRKVKPYSLFAHINITNQRSWQAPEVPTSQETEEESPNEVSSSRVPTEPAARKLFIQQVSQSAVPPFFL